MYCQRTPFQWCQLGIDPRLAQSSGWQVLFVRITTVAVVCPDRSNSIFIDATITQFNAAATLFVPTPPMIDGTALHSRWVEAEFLIYRGRLMKGKGTPSVWKATKRAGVYHQFGRLSKGQGCTISLEVSNTNINAYLCIQW